MHSPAAAGQVYELRAIGAKRFTPAAAATSVIMVYETAPFMAVDPSGIAASKGLNRGDHEPVHRFALLSRPPRADAPVDHHRGT